MRGSTLQDLRTDRKVRAVERRIIDRIYRTHEAEQVNAGVGKADQLAN